MNDELQSSCEISARPTSGTAGSRILRFHDFRWQGVPAAEYKQEGNHWAGVARMALAGESGEHTGFHLRYFEIAPGGFSSLEKHQHEHVVVVIRGRGEVLLGGRLDVLQFGDTVYVAPEEPHQFRNNSTEPFGFLCVVDAQRDRPQILTGG